MIKIFDGAMGTILQAQGILKPDVCPELLNIENAATIIKVHQQYIDAGANIIETNTFGASSIKLTDFHLESKASEINIAGVKNAKVAMSGRGKVAGSMGPTGKFISPLGDISFEEVYEAYKEQAKALADGGADYILIETCIDLQEMRAALLAAKEAAPQLPIICQMSYSDEGRTVTGTDPQTAAITLEAMGADIIGANCSTGPEELLPIVKILADNCSCPISVQPNAGMPHLVNGKTIFPMTPADMGKWAPKLIAAGATYIGGCCGTTPEHIKAIKDAVKNLHEAVRSPIAKRLALTSRTKTIFISSDLPTKLIGERINPSGRKKLAAEIKDNSFILVKKEAVNQTNAGATVLDVNMGVAGISQSAAMKNAVSEIAQIVPTPLSIDTSDAKALEAGLRAYPGRALINSVSAEPNRLKYFLPLAKKYGAAVLCLPLSEAGLPETARERVAIIKKIVHEGKNIGLTDNDFILDCLVMTIAADKTAATEVLQTLTLYKEELGYPSTMGLSNISFGLPNRPLINSTFFAMCLGAGLDAPIMNPYDEAMQNTLAAAAALTGKDSNGRSYSLWAADTKSSEPAVAPEVLAKDIIEAIKHSIIIGEKENIAGMVERAIKEGYTSNEITEKALTGAMAIVGKDFGAKKIFLPQVMLSAEAMRQAFLKIKELLPAQKTVNNGTVVIATVKGDIHDLGKNIVAALLENNGFRIIDLGKDVDSEDIVKAAIDNDADLVGLCSLMTTTMTQIDKVVASLKKLNAKARVIVGGAVLTKDYADTAGADAYAENGVEAVNIAKKLMGIA